YLMYVGDQVGGNAGFNANLAQTIRVRAVLGADDEDHVDQLGQFEEGSLAVLCRVTDVLRPRTDDVLETAEERRDDSFGIVNTERGLGHVGDRRILRKIKPIYVRFGLHEDHGPGDLSQR